MATSQNLNINNAADYPTTSSHLQSTYTLKELSITLKNGEKVDLTSVFKSMEVFEDVFKYSITGRISINDYVGGQEKFLITGGEKITFTALKPDGMNDIIVTRSDLIVTKLSDIKVEKGNTRKYDIHFSSQIKVNASKRKIFKSYGNDRNLKNVVEKIYTEIGGSSNELLQTDKSKIPLLSPFISAGYDPLEAINMLAKRAGVNGDYFLFFERFGTTPKEKFKHAFVSIAELRNYWEKLNFVPKIVYEPKVGLVSYLSADTEKVILSDFVKVESNFDHPTNVMVGFYNSRIRSINLLNRSYSDSNLNYLNDTTISDIYNNKFLEKDNVFSQFDDTTIERLIVSPQNDAIRDKQKWLKTDTYGGILNTSVRVTARISGGSNHIFVGSLIDLSMQSDVSKTTNTDVPARHEDQMYSGKYVVTAVKHVFTPKAYEKVLELSRGSLKVSIDKILEKFKT